MSLRDTLEKMLRAGQTEAVLQTAGEHFRQVRTPSPDDAWIASAACWAAAVRREWGMAVDWAERGLALDPLEPEVEGRLRLIAGTALFYSDDLYGAEEELNRFLQLAEDCPPLARYKGDALYNLAYVTRGFRRPDEEVGFFGRAAEVYASLGRHSRVSVCRYEIGWSHLLAGQPTRAITELEQARAGLLADPDAELEADLQIGMALYHSLAGDLKESERLCEALVGRADLQRRQRAELAWLRSRNAASAQETDRAIGLIEEAYAVAVEEWIPTQLERIEDFRTQLLTTVQKGR